VNGERLLDVGTKRGDRQKLCFNPTPANRCA
jgi:hypothetical protein